MSGDLCGHHTSGQGQGCAGHIKQTKDAAQHLTKHKTTAHDRGLSVSRARGSDTPAGQWGRQQVSGEGRETRLWWTLVGTLALPSEKQCVITGVCVGGGEAQLPLSVPGLVRARAWQPIGKGSGSKPALARRRLGL